MVPRRELSRTSLEAELKRLHQLGPPLGPPQVPPLVPPPGPQLVPPLGPQLLGRRPRAETMALLDREPRLLLGVDALRTDPDVRVPRLPLHRPHLPLLKAVAASKMKLRRGR